MPPSPLVFTYNNPKSVLLSDTLGTSGSSTISVIDLQSPNLVLQGVTLTLQAFDNSVLLNPSTSLLIENITVMASVGTDTLGTVAFVLQYPNPVPPPTPSSSLSMLKKEEEEHDNDIDEITLEDSALVPPSSPVPREDDVSPFATSDDTHVSKTSSYVGGASGIFVEYLFGNVIYQYNNTTGGRTISIYSSSV